MSTDRLSLRSADEAREILARFPAVSAPIEPVALEAADGRVLAEDALAPEDLPAWPRAMMDGYAIRAADVAGATEAAPASLTLRGSIAMGEPWTGRLEAGDALGISTGGVVPDGADAVIMIEHTRRAGDTIEIARAVRTGENLTRPGDDFARGDVVAPRGRRLRPHDLGALAALGITRVGCVRRPIVAVLSTGNEIVAHGDTPPIGRVRDVNQLALSAKIRRAGGEPILGGIARDDAAELEARARELLARADLLLLSGGSSIGVRDLTAAVLDSMGVTILFHGIDVRPGKPTIAARAGDKPILGMPGVPASASIIFDVFVRPLIRRLGGERAGSAAAWTSRRRARLSRRIASVVGREDWIRVRLVEPPGGLPEAEPLAGGQSSLATLVRADGLVVVPAATDGLPEGAEVEVLS